MAEPKTIQALGARRQALVRTRTLPKCAVTLEFDSGVSERGGLLGEAPGVAVIALGGTRRPGREGISWPPLRSLGHRHFSSSITSWVYALGQGRRRTTPTAPGPVSDLS